MNLSFYLIILICGFTLLGYGQNRQSYISATSLTQYVSTTKGSLQCLNKYAPFNKLTYNKVILYEFDGGKPYLNIVEENGKLSEVITKQWELSQAQADSLLTLLADKSTYGSGSAACFTPHMGIVLYQNTQVVMHISICLDCNYLSSSIPIPAMGKMATGLPNGFSSRGKATLQKLSDRYGIFYTH